jgi:hypothetical protein
VTVVSVQAVLSRKPHESLPILVDGVDGRLRQSIGDGQMLEADRDVSYGDWRGATLGVGWNDE